MGDSHATNTLTVVRQGRSVRAMMLPHKTTKALLRPDGPPVDVETFGPKCSAGQALTWHQMLLVRWTQRRLEVALGMSYGSSHRWLTGWRLPELRTAIRVSELLMVDTRLWIVPLDAEELIDVVNAVRTQPRIRRNGKSTKDVYAIEAHERLMEHATL